MADSPFHSAMGWHLFQNVTKIMTNYENSRLEVILGIIFEHFSED
jgi:hypothetical protein